MPIVIKEIHVRTTVERRPEEHALSAETMAALKRSILKEMPDNRYGRNIRKTKDR